MSQQINLFDPALQRQYDPWTSQNLLRILLAILAVSAVLSAAATWRNLEQDRAILTLAPELESARQEVKQLNEQLGNRKPDARLEAELNNARLRLDARSEVLEILRKGLAPEATTQADWLRGMARQVPTGLWLTAFSVNTDTEHLEIRGRTLDPALIPEYVRRLNAEKAFKGRTFAALQIAGNKPPADNRSSTAIAVPAAPTSATGASPQRYHEFTLSAVRASDSRTATEPQP